jgi:hypothetical protein
MEAIFNLCVEILIWISEFLGISYQAANIWIFVIIHPLLTIIFFWLMMNYRNKWKNEVSVVELLIEKNN